MDEMNDGITREDIARIRDNPRIFKWNHWNRRYPRGVRDRPTYIKRRWSLTNPLEIIETSEVLLCRPELIILHNEVLTRSFIGFTKLDNWDFKGIQFGRKRTTHNDYVMCMVLENDNNGYVAYRIHPSNSFILDEIYVSSNMPHSTGRFPSFAKSSEWAREEDASKPIEQRSKPLDEFIKELGDCWYSGSIVFQEGKNLVVTKDEVGYLISGKGRPLFDAKLPEGYVSSITNGQQLAKYYLEVFKLYLDELCIPYRR